MMSAQLIEQGQVVILTGSIIKGRRPFYWILLKEANLYHLAGECIRGGLAQWIAPRTMDRGVPGSRL